MEFGDMKIHAKVKKNPKIPNNQMKKEDSNSLVIYKLQKKLIYKKFESYHRLTIKPMHTHMI